MENHIGPARRRGGNHLMGKQSAGILLWRRAGSGGIEVLLVHPGGPFWRRRDAGAWSLPKGEFALGDDELAAARREFDEELGRPPPAGEVLALGEVVQRGGKRVVAFAIEGDFDLAALRSNSFSIEWPPRSGRTATFPEVDAAAWLNLAAAREKILPAQAPFLDRLAALL
jgi:predicted NUDIX family NTP pyrophosphohydrolase